MEEETPVGWRRKTSRLERGGGIPCGEMGGDGMVGVEVVAFVFWY